jgi:hypothetical protein
MSIATKLLGLFSLENSTRSSYFDMCNVEQVEQGGLTTLGFGVRQCRNSQNARNDEVGCTLEKAKRYLIYDA